MKSARLILLVVLLTISLNSISALTIKSESESNVIIPEFNHPAQFTLTITNAAEGSYTIYTLTDVEILPTSPFYFTKGTNKINIFVYPRTQLTERGSYTFSYHVGETQSKLTAKIVDLEDAIEISSDAIDPESNEITFYIRTKEKISLQNLKAKFTSAIFETEKEFDLEPLEKTEITVKVDKNKLKKTRAGTYIIQAEFETINGEKIIEGKIHIGEKKNIVTEQDSAGFLIRTKTITKINSGNINENVQIVVKKNILSRLFTSFNTEPISIDRTGFTITYQWNQQLKPTEVFTIKIKTNYIFPLLIIVASILIIWGFKRFIQTKVEITKSVSPIKTKGGEFALRVKLSVRSRNHVENVSLIDRIPAVVKIYKKFGTSKPDRIDTTNRKIQWNLGTLNSGEERVFSYIIYSKIGVVGKFSLPKAFSTFEINNEIHEVESNKVFFLSEQTSRDE
ncbi:hypothetical protein CMI37_17380 [Candidatus Pacearchaeota archaeon]|nr:hypothetical protein [Candidatus Pacearchaeota archaeon]|tara:strand:- start:3037 stop:4392 length:1356 start_codon:yes stop_codon:yes gene_type:complete